MDIYVTDILPEPPRYVPVNQAGSRPNNFGSNPFQINSTISNFTQNPINPFPQFYQNPLGGQLSNTHFLNNLQGLDPNLQILFPQLLLSLQTTQDLANKVINQLFQASSPVKGNSNHKKVYSYWLPLTGNFSISPSL